MALTFGHIDGYPEGSEFDSRKELRLAGVHRPNQAGIAGRASEGADSIVLSGGYEDDEDHGDVIIYTGQGGRDPNTATQAENQELVAGNMALVKSQQEGLPVRVVRGERHKSPFSPSSGYRYDGLYRVADHWRERGRSGFFVWRFRLEKIGDEPAPTAQPTLELELPKRVETTVQRVVRDTQLAKDVKRLYGHRCQVCGEVIEGPAGPYAEAAHIRPLGRPHDGPDSVDNILCLCPNHHVMFDLGVFAIGEDYRLLGIEGELTVDARHEIGGEHLAYRRGMFEFE